MQKHIRVFAGVAAAVVATGAFAQGAPDSRGLDLAIERANPKAQDQLRENRERKKSREAEKARKRSERDARKAREKSEEMKEKGKRKAKGKGKKRERDEKSI